MRSATSAQNLKFASSHFTFTLIYKHVKKYILQKSMLTTIEVFFLKAQTVSVYGSLQR